ncbi:FtsX-like permease family protein [Cryptosporangium sp. NPDC051539]|uniref:FtsX-like permease family protein n=1 Tax=Cryptosporangium sp. NPDC051539 TaxID=3363962 RepID=UPI0037A71050
MITLGLRLTLAGGKEAASRLAIIAAAVALGVGLLLATLAALHATDTQTGRYAWIFSGSATAQPAAGDPLWFSARSQLYDGQLIGRIDVAATGPGSPVPPGLPRLPAPGEYYASPALTALLRDVPAAELGDRFPGHRAGRIGRSALPGPDSLIVVVGLRPDQLAKDTQATRVTAFRTSPPARCSGCPNLNANGQTLVLYVAVAALIFPVLVLIGMATRLAAARREQRFAAMRLVGATPRQISTIATVESTVATVLGVGAGFGLFFAFHPLLARVDFTGTRFFASDLALRPAQAALVAAGVPVLAAVAARIALRRVRISPLGVTRRVTPRPPRAWRLIPLAAGLGVFAYFVGRIPKSTVEQIQVYTAASLLVLAGIVIAGPWLTLLGARLMARRVRSPALLIAGRRLSDDPKAGFRAVSGLVLALCVASGSIALMTTITAKRGVSEASAAVGGAMLTDFITERDDITGEPVGAPPPPPAATLIRLRSIDGVRGVTLVHTNPLGTKDPAWGDPAEHGPPHDAGLASCTDLATMPGFSVCPPGAEAASVAPGFGAIGWGDPGDWPRVWPAAAISTAALARLPVQQIVVGTDGSTTAIEQVRTVLLNAYPDARAPMTVGEQQTSISASMTQYQQLADVVTVVSLVIAGFSLAVSLAGGLSERKRPFSLLRLTGVQLGVLRRVVLLESAVPLLIVSAVAIGTGFLAADLFLRAQYEFSVQAPGLGYYVVVSVGLGISLAIIASTLPLLRRITGPETARND